MSVKSSTELMLYVVLTMPTLNKAYLLLFIYLFIYVTPIALTAELLHVINHKMQLMAALHMREHIVPGVYLPEEDIIVLHLSLITFLS
jgi:hypothetical protein